MGPFFNFAIEAGLGSAKQVNKTLVSLGRDWLFFLWTYLFLANFSHFFSVANDGTKTVLWENATEDQGIDT